MPFRTRVLASRGCAVIRVRRSVRRFGRARYSWRRGRGCSAHHTTAKLRRRGHRYRRRLPSEGQVMAKAMVEVLVDDLDGSEGAETVRIGWNGEWRGLLELSKKNVSALSRALDRYWDVSRPARGMGAGAVGPGRHRRGRLVRPSAAAIQKMIRAWAIDNGISVPARGRIPRRRGTSVQRRPRTFVAVIRRSADPCGRLR